MPSAPPSPNARRALLWVETTSNPLLRITDIADLAALGRGAGALVVVDNTFATPALQQPLALGADVVVRSTTKYLGGHSDLVGGALVLSEAHRGGPLADEIGFLQYAVGAVSGPLDAWLTTRGIKTLAVRMQRHSENAASVAAFLQGHERIARVYYPGLVEHPGHDLAVRQMSGFRGIVSVALESQEAARRFAESTRLFQLAESLGGVESLVAEARRHDTRLGAPAPTPPSRSRLCACRSASRTSPTCWTTSRWPSPPELPTAPGVIQSLAWGALSGTDVIAKGGAIQSLVQTEL